MAPLSIDELFTTSKGNNLYLEDYEGNCALWGEFSLQKQRVPWETRDFNTLPLGELLQEQSTKPAEPTIPDPVAPAGTFRNIRPPVLSSLAQGLGRNRATNGGQPCSGTTYRWYWCPVEWGPWADLANWLYEWRQGEEAVQGEEPTGREERRGAEKSSWRGARTRTSRRLAVEQTEGETARSALPWAPAETLTMFTDQTMGLQDYVFISRGISAEQQTLILASGQIIWRMVLEKHQQP